MINLITLAPNQFQFICDFRILCQDNRLMPSIKNILLNKFNEMSSNLVGQEEKMRTGSPQFFKASKASPEDKWNTFKTKIDKSSKSSDLGFIAMQMNQFIQKHQKEEISLNLSI